MCSANCFFEVLRTTKNYTDQTSQINSGSVLLVTGAQLTAYLHCALFLFPRAFTGCSNLWISSGVWKVEQVITSCTEGTKVWGLTVPFKVS